MNDDFGPTLEGLQIPEVVILPPEVIHLLSRMTLAELKITIAAVARCMTIGGNEPITLSEFESITVLAQCASVTEGIERALKRGLMIRYEISGYQGHKYFVYELRPKFIGSKNEQMPLLCCCVNSTGGTSGSARYYSVTRQIYRRMSGR